MNSSQFSELDLFSSPYAIVVLKKGSEISMEQIDQQQLQQVRTELIVEQYHSLREEIIQRVQARQQMWYVLLLVAGTFLSIGVQPSTRLWCKMEALRRLQKP